MVSSQGIVHPCGQCLFCRINRKREWISRLLLEAASHNNNQFWTLTYENDQLPTSLPPGEPKWHPGQGGVQGLSSRAELGAVLSQNGSLFKPDLQGFFKRFRRNYGDLRYYAVGEYGTRLGRPHYHVLAFGVQIDVENLKECWGHGHVHIGDVESASINYCVEYALKKEKSKELVDLRRQPEFSVMSTVPAIGSYAIGEFRKAILASDPLPTGELLIPDTFKLCGREYPVPRFFRNELENEGFLSSRKAAKKYAGDSEVMRALLSRSRVATQEFEKFQVLWSDDPVTEIQARKQVEAQRILNAESKQRIFGKRHETL